MKWFYIIRPQTYRQNDTGTSGNPTQRIALLHNGDKDLCRSRIQAPHHADDHEDGMARDLDKHVEGVEKIAHAVALGLDELGP